MQQLVESLSGRKAYIVAVAMILYGIAGGVAGVLSTEDAARFVLEGLGIAATRAGIAKVGEKREGR